MRSVIETLQGALSTGNGPEITNKDPTNDYRTSYGEVIRLAMEVVRKDPSADLSAIFYVKSAAWGGPGWDKNQLDKSQVHKFSDVLKASGLPKSNVTDPIEQMALISIVDGRSIQESPEVLQIYELAFSWLSESETLGQVAAAIENLILGNPKMLMDFVPFENLIKGDATVRGRLGELNLLLIAAGCAPKMKYIVMEPLDVQSADLLDTIVKLYYYAAVVEKYAVNKEIQESVRLMSQSVAESYRAVLNRCEPMVESALDAVLVQTARVDPQYFLELDTRYKLVDITRIMLLEQLPAAYIRSHHIQDVVGMLSVRSSTVKIIANLFQDSEAIRLVDASQVSLLKLTHENQLRIAAGAASSNESFALFREKYPQVLRHAKKAEAYDDETAQQVSKVLRADK